MVLADALKLARARVDGARGLWLVGLDGVLVAGAEDGTGLPVEWLAASFADVLCRARSAGAEADLAPPSELTVAGPTGVVVVRPLGDEHALVALVASTAIPGRARHQLRLAAEEVQAELLA